MKRIYVGKNYESGNCVDTGYDVEIMKRKNGSYAAVATSRSCWSGSYDDVTYRGPDRDTIEDAKVDAKRVLNFDVDLDREDCYCNRDWTMISKGYVVS